MSWRVESCYTFSSVIEFHSILKICLIHVLLWDVWILLIQRIKLPCFEVLLKWCYSSRNFRYTVNINGHGQSGNFKAWFCGKIIVTESKKFFWNSFLHILKMPKQKKKRSLPYRTLIMHFCNDLFFLCISAIF